MKTAIYEPSLSERSLCPSEVVSAPVERPDSASLGLIARSFQKVVFTKLKSLEHGAVTLQDGTNVFHFGDASESGLSATIYVNRHRFYQRLVLGGVLGAAESFLDGDWEVDDLTALFRIFARNMSSTQTLNSPISTASRQFSRIKHFLARNTLKGSRKNIEAHYDLGDDFFRLFLDRSMMYSSAIYEEEGMSLEEAQIARLERICRKLELKPEDHVLEIGTGWGGFALYAAQNYGCRITTTTISENQYKTARERIKEAGLEDRVTVLKQDYRALQGRYDKLVSIEMIEAVGHAYFDTFFKQCGELLKEEGRMLLQAIVMPEQRYEQYLNSVDFIQKYIFPGGCLPSVVRMQQSVASQTNLRLLELQDFAPHYAQTLRDWRERLERSLEEVGDSGYPARFLRMWDYYFCYCEAAFDERAVGVVHAVWGK